MISLRQSLLVLLAVLPWVARSSAFEGRVQAIITQGSETRAFLYTVGTNYMRIECMETNWPFAKNIINLDSGAVTLLFPHNRSFMRLKPASESSASPFPDVPAMPLPPGGLPPGIGPQVLAVPPSMPAVIGPTNLPGVPAAPHIPDLPKRLATLPPGIGPQGGATPAMPGMPAGMPPMAGMQMMPPMGMEQAELQATSDTTNLLGYVCARYELKQGGEVMEIWATGKLLPYQAWLPNQPARLGPRTLEDRWPELLKERQNLPFAGDLEIRTRPRALPLRGQIHHAGEDH